MPDIDSDDVGEQAVSFTEAGGGAGPSAWRDGPGKPRVEKKTFSAADVVSPTLFTLYCVIQAMGMHISFS